MVFDSHCLAHNSDLLDAFLKFFLSYKVQMIDYLVKKNQLKTTQNVWKTDQFKNVPFFYLLKKGKWSLWLLYFIVLYFRIGAKILLSKFSPAANFFI